LLAKVSLQSNKRGKGMECDELTAPPEQAEYDDDQPEDDE